MVWNDKLYQNYRLESKHMVDLRNGDTALPDHLRPEIFNNQDEGRLQHSE